MVAKDRSSLITGVSHDRLNAFSFSHIDFYSSIFVFVFHGAEREAVEHVEFLRT